MPAPSAKSTAPPSRSHIPTRSPWRIAVANAMAASHTPESTPRATPADRGASIVESSNAVAIAAALGTRSPVASVCS